MQYVDVHASASEVGFGSLCCFFSSRRRHTRFDWDWSSDVCSSDLIVTQQLQYAAGAVHPLETSIAADPQGARLVLQHPRDAAAAQGAQMKEPVVLGLPAIEPRFGADPQDPRAVEAQGADAVIDQRARVREIGRAHV